MLGRLSVFIVLMVAVSISSIKAQVIRQPELKHYFVFENIAEGTNAPAEISAIQLPNLVVDTALLAGHHGLLLFSDFNAGLIFLFSTQTGNLYAKQLGIGELPMQFYWQEKLNSFFWGTTSLGAITGGDNKLFRISADLGLMENITPSGGINDAHFSYVEDDSTMLMSFSENYDSEGGWLFQPIGFKRVHVFENTTKPLLSFDGRKPGGVGVLPSQTDVFNTACWDTLTVDMNSNVLDYLHNNDIRCIDSVCITSNRTLGPVVHILGEMPVLNSIVNTPLKSTPRHIIAGGMLTPATNIKPHKTVPNRISGHACRIPHFGQPLTDSTIIFGLLNNGNCEVDSSASIDVYRVNYQDSTMKRVRFIEPPLRLLAAGKGSFNWVKNPTQADATIDSAWIAFNYGGGPGAGYFGYPAGYGFVEENFFLPRFGLVNEYNQLLVGGNIGGVFDGLYEVNWCFDAEVPEAKALVDGPSGNARISCEEQANGSFLFKVEGFDNTDVRTRMLTDSVVLTLPQEPTTWIGLGAAPNNAVVIMDITLSFDTRYEHCKAYTGLFALPNNFDALYPNPVNAGESLIVRARVASHYTIVNISGAQVHQGWLQQGENSLSIDLPAGVYFLRMGYSTAKLVVN